MAGTDIVGCVACDLAAGRKELPGGEIARTANWVVEHCIGPLGVGTLVLKPIRHCAGLWDLTSEEAAELGPALQLFTQLVKEVSSADQVFCSLWSFSGGEPGHIHYVLQPVTRALRDRVGKSGPFIQTAMFEADETLPLAAVEQFCDKARDWLRQHSPTALAITVPGTG